MASQLRPGSQSEAPVQAGVQVDSSMTVVQA